MTERSVGSSELTTADSISAFVTFAQWQTTVSGVVERLCMALEK